MLSPLILLALSPAIAGDGYDAHGFNMVTGSGDTLEGQGVYDATANTPGSFAVRGMLEAADETLNIYFEHPETGEESSYEVLGELYGINLGGFYALNERVAVSGALPVWFHSEDPNGAHGMALGDVRVTVPINVLLRDPSERSVGLAFIPTLTLPTGAEERYLGNNQATLGGLAVATVGDDRWKLSANAGLDWRGPTGPELASLGLKGGLFAVGGLGVSYDLLPDKLAATAELRSSAALNEHLVAGYEAPLEVAAGLRAKSDSGLGLDVTVSKGISRGAGAAEWRVLAGVSYSGARNQSASPTPVLVAAPSEADLLVTVVDPAGHPIPGAQVDLAGAQQVADIAGRVRYEDLQPGSDVRLDVSATTWEPEHLSVALLEGENARVVMLDPMDGTVKVIALDEHGAPIDARVRFLAGPEDQAVSQLGEDGERSFSLAAGDWTVLVATDSNVPEQRSVTLPRAGLETIYVQFSDEELIPICSENVTLRNVNFDFDVDVPRPEATPILQSLARTLLDCPDIRLEVGGHTDWVGSDAYNIDLSQRRMNSVKAALVSYGVPEDRLVPVGYGESQPLTTNATDEGRAVNRRVAFQHIQEPSSADAQQ